MVRIAQCPVCKTGGTIDLKVLGICLSCHMKRRLWEKRRGYSREMVITACALAD